MPAWLIILLTLIIAYLVQVVVRQFLTREKKVRYELEHLYRVSDDQFLRSMGNILPPPILPGNQVTPLVNGDEIFPEMLDAIRSARRTVTFETFIYWSGRIGREIAEALAQRARAGVRVHVLLDWIGSNRIDPQVISALKSAGAQVERYHPIHWWNLDHINHRTHRKLLVVDGRIGFTGGVGIGDEWTGDAQDPHHWRDTHFRIEGPVVAQLQSAFMDNWLKTQARVLDGPDYFPALEPAGPSLAQAFRSSPDEGAESVRLMYLMAISAAVESIRLSSAYFVPDELAIDTLVSARERGVSVRIIVPGPHMDYRIVRRASRALWGRLLEAGVEIHEYQPTMYHAKAMIVDDRLVSVGSTNFDQRAFRLNDEVTLNVIDMEFARRMAGQFQRDLGRARRITLDDWRNRPWSEKLRENAAALLKSQL
jgi:cardiolipin synthase A/B